MKVDYFICPECGAEVRVGSKGCGKCASERATKNWREDPKPWEQDDVYDGLDLPYDEFDYQKFIAEEFGSGPKRLESMRQNSCARPCAMPCSRPSARSCSAIVATASSAGEPSR